MKSIIKSVSKFKIIVFSIALAFTIIDQLIKYIVDSSMQLYQSIPVINNVFHITYVLNDGAAFSFLSGQTWILCGVTSALMIFLIWIFFSKKTVHPLLISSLGLVISGGIGNLIDRFFNSDVLFQGKVIDYFDFCLIDFAIFNFADCCITIGTVLLAVFLIFYDKPKEKTEENADE